ncbi:agmatine deiminase family protein [Kitasatospora sp. YST-16]|uniref:agmatine deiminase family protein n=1 Tax=Kitasatospora sp. YST-16 TaxID=2998080 RepID=UPI002283FE8D|nr:agmatine deiminase family protein [Kitasatospora sp. YST-16]WAL71230.1 agmatine deiminase family protein [Kitasatospora sp. YST-16]WNW37266.1 agmatine deiminase family protein [Streptomyces sp. Li-HN-5-13]
MSNSPTPASLGFKMPAEWHPHQRTWMAFPTPNPTFDGPEQLDAARRAWAEVANTVVRYEPVTLVVNTGESEDARRYLAAEVEIVERPLNDAWMRDIGPSFLIDGNGELAAADWVFNGWGAQSWARWDKDQDIAEHVTDLTGARRFASRLINEGGGIHVDGEGTVLVTDTVQLGEGRNADWTREQVEAELHAHLGTTKAIWLPRGLTRDYDEFGTRGHIDIVAAFVRPGTVVVHSQPDPAHPDHAVCRELADLLRTATDARGRTLEVIELPAPTALFDEDGEPVDYSYINHYVANGAVILCAFDDPRDEQAKAILEKAYPGRTVELVDAREIFANGGGIHCITQQQPQP